MNLELLSPLEPNDDDTERFARELAEDLQGDRLEVVWTMIDDRVYLARRETEDAEVVE